MIDFMHQIENIAEQYSLKISSLDATDVVQRTPVTQVWDGGGQRADGRLTAEKNVESQVGRKRLMATLRNRRWGAFGSGACQVR
jgi:hypothetical protein